MTKFVTVDENNIVLEPYDSKYNNVPVDAIEITEGEFIILQTKPFNYFKIVGSALVLRDEATDMANDQIVNGVDDTEFMRVFVELLIDEINILRNVAGLEPRTLAQFKIAMKGKL